MPLEKVWKIFADQLFFAHHAFEIKIHSFVLMHNHYHLILSTPKHNLSAAMAYFQREVSRELNRQGNRINQTFAGRYHKCHLGSLHYYFNCYKYVYYNPVKSGAADRCENYPFSTLPAKLGLQPLPFPVAEDTMILDGDLTSTLTWLNHPPRPKDTVSIKRALKSHDFKLRKDPTSKKTNDLEIDFY